MHLRDGGPALHHWTTVLDEALAAIVYIEDEDLAAELNNEIERTSQDLPIVRDLTNRFLPLDPTQSRTVGLAFIKRIDEEEHEIEIVSPHAAEIFDLASHSELSIAADGTISTESPGDGENISRLVLLQGYYDAPTWAYMSSIHYARHVKRAKRQELLEQKPHLAEEIAWADELKTRAARIETQRGRGASGVAGGEAMKYLEPVSARRGDGHSDRRRE